MVATATDRLNGLTTSLAVKPPVRIVTTSNITLYGIQTLEGTALAAKDRVLVAAQTDPADNGIYIVGQTVWQRAKDFDGARDAVNGTLILCESTPNIMWRVVCSDDPIVIGESDITFESAFGGGTSASFGNYIISPRVDPTLASVHTLLVLNLPAGSASFGGAIVNFPAVTDTMPASTVRLYEMNTNGTLSYTDIAANNYTQLQRDPDKLQIWRVESSATDIVSVRLASSTYPIIKREDDYYGTIDAFNELFYLYDSTTAWSSSTAVTYGQILVTTAGRAYQVAVAGTTGGTAPTSTAAGNITDGTATLFYYGRTSYLGMYRYGANNGINYYFCNLGLYDVLHKTLVTGSTLGAPAGTTVASLVKKYLQGAFKHVVATRVNSGTYLLDMKVTGGGYRWRCSVAGTASGSDPFSGSYSVGDTETDGGVTWTCIGTQYSTHNWYWLDTDRTFDTYSAPDSHDSYASTFASLLARYIRYTDDYSWLTGASPQPSGSGTYWTYEEVFGYIMDANLDTQISNFLTKTFQNDINPRDGSAFATQYLEDNCESVKGFRDAAYVYGVLGDSAAETAALGNETYVGSGVAALLDTDYNLFGFYYGDDVSTWADRDGNAFYPYVQAQFFPQKCRVASVKDSTYRDVRQAAFEIYPNWFNDKGKDSYPNNFLGLMAATQWGDQAFAHKMIEQTDRYFINNNSMTITEYGAYLATKDALAPPARVLSVAGSTVITEAGIDGNPTRTTIGSSAWGGITGTLSNQTDLQTALNAKVAANGSITGATKTKITYDAKGLVTAGADATTADIADSSDKRYVTDAQLTVIGNTSGTNTGDQDLSGLVPYTGATGDVTLGTHKLTASAVQANGSGGGELRTNSGAAALHWGSGGSANGTLYGGWNYDNGTANTLVSLGASKTITSLDTATYPNLTEISYVKGVTSAIQTQLDAKQASGTYLTSVAVASSNGFTGSSSGGATPTITLTTSVSGLLKGNGTAISAAAAGTDYSAGTSALATGILKSTTGTGALTIAVAGDFPTLNQNTTGSAATLTTTRTIWGQNFNGSANVTGTLALGTADLTMTGSIAATGARVTKGWFTDIESTNAPTIGGSAATGSGGLVRATSPTLVTPTLGAATATSIDTGSGAIANIYSGTYTPTLTGVTNVSASSAGQAFYMRVGAVVHVSMRINITPTATGSTSIRISLPVASNITTTGSVNGVARNRSTVTFQVGTVYGDTANEAALLIFDATSTSNLEWNMTFTYLVA